MRRAVLPAMPALTSPGSIELIDAVRAIAVTSLGFYPQYPQQSQYPQSFRRSFSTPFCHRIAVRPGGFPFRTPRIPFEPTDEIAGARSSLWRTGVVPAQKLSHASSSARHITSHDDIVTEFPRLIVATAAAAGRYGDIVPTRARHRRHRRAPPDAAEGEISMTGFKKFLLRGNLVDLAVAVVVGVAFNTVVQALIKDLITPLIAAVWKQPDFANMVFIVNGSRFFYGSFINVALSFVIIAAVVYYFVVVPANRVTTLAERNAETTERPCPECLSDIPVKATRCKFCTAAVEPYPNGQQAQASPAGSHRLRPPTWRPRS